MIRKRLILVIVSVGVLILWFLPKPMVFGKEQFIGGEITTCPVCVGFAQKNLDGDTCYGIPFGCKTAFINEGPLDPCELLFEEECRDEIACEPYYSSSCDGCEDMNYMGCRYSWEDLEDEGIVHGTIGLFSGNCMPSPGFETCSTPEGIPATIYITEPTEKYDEALLVTKIETNEKGEYWAKLPEGNYSLFIYDTDLEYYGTCNENHHYACDGEGFFVCRSMGYSDGARVCEHFTIEASRITLADRSLDHAAW